MRELSLWFQVEAIPISVVEPPELAEDIILHQAESERRAEEAELIAMASHGRTGLARVFYGSVAAGVLHGTDRPLLLVRSMEAE